MSEIIVLIAITPTMIIITEIAFTTMVIITEIISYQCCVCLCMLYIANSFIFVITQ